MGCFYHFFSYQEFRPSLFEDDFQLGSKKRDLDELRQSDTGKLLHCYWNVGVWMGRLYKTGNKVKKRIQDNFRYRRSLAAYQLLEKIWNGKLFRYVQCDIKVTGKLGANLLTFLQSSRTL